MQPQCNRKFCQFNKDQYCNLHVPKSVLVKAGKFLDTQSSIDIWNIYLSVYGLCVSTKFM